MIKPMPRTSAQQLGDAWEEDVRQFFRALGFDVDGGTNFRPGERKIDVVAGIDNVLLIGKCKTTEELSNSNLAVEIRKFRKKTLKAILGFQGGYNGGKYSRYTHFVLFLATNGMIITKGDTDALTESLEGRPYKALHFDENFFDYYNLIKNQLSDEIARWQLLADLGIRSLHQDSLKVFALKTKTKDFDIYHFVANPKKILPYVTVARRSSRQKDYYQRMISGSRAQSIIDYLNKPDNVFPRGPIIPGNIILAAQPEIDMNNDGRGNSRWISVRSTNIDCTVGIDESVDYGIYTVPNIYGALWIVDGQHRLYSYSKTPTAIDRNLINDDKVLITLLCGFNLSQQSKVFVDINNEQKKVNFDYIIDIEGDADADSEIGTISRLIKDMDKLVQVEGESNYLCSKIRIPSHGLNREFSMKGFYQAILRFKLTLDRTKNTGNPYYVGANCDIGALSKSLIQYINTSVKVLGTDLQGEENGTGYNILEKLKGHGKDGIMDILIGFYERILAANNKVRNRTAKPDIAVFEKYLKPVAEKLKNIRDEQEYSNFISTSGHGPRDDTVRRMCSEVLNAGFPEFEFDDLDLDINKIAADIGNIESLLRELINKELCIRSVDWCKGDKPELLSMNIFGALKAKATGAGDLERNPLLITEGRLYGLLDWNQSKTIIMDEQKEGGVLVPTRFWDSIFSRIFVEGGNKFTGKEQLKTAFSHLALYRNTADHKVILDERNIRKAPEQKNMADNYLRIFHKVLDPIQLLPEVREIDEPDTEEEAN